MKILFIGSDTADYQNDVLLHGFKQKFGDLVIDVPQKSCMYDGLPDPGPIYGNGFTIFKTLKLDNINRSDIKPKIQDRFFDLIVYGSVRRNLSYIYDVIPLYDKNQVVFIDGEDDTSIYIDLLKYGIYFKRELDSYIDGVHPVSFGFPEEKIPKTFCKKIKQISNIIPDFNQNYTFNVESEYYKEYQQSMFAWTWKKAGWDCMRHYEILFNRCLPLFFELNKLPNQTMVDFPRSQIEAYQNRFFEKTRGVYKDSMRILDRIDENEYNDVVDSVFNYCKDNLTTKRCVEKILNYL